LADLAITLKATCNAESGAIGYVSTTTGVAFVVVVGAKREPLLLIDFPVFHAAAL